MNQIASTYNSTGGNIYIVELEAPFERLEFQFVPQELSWSRQPKLIPVEVVARNNDFHQLTGGNDTISLQLDFFAADMNRDSVINKVDWLRSLSMIPQRNVRLVWGDMFKNYVFIVSAVEASFSNFRQGSGYNPQQAYVDITLKMNPSESITINEVRGQSITSSVNNSSIGFL